MVVGVAAGSRYVYLSLCLCLYHSPTYRNFNHLFFSHLCYDIQKETDDRRSRSKTGSMKEEDSHLECPGHLARKRSWLGAKRKFGCPLHMYMHCERHALVLMGVSLTH